VVSQNESKEEIPMSKQLLTVEIQGKLYDEFWSFAGSKGGPWRSRKQTAQDGIESAVEVALREFLEKYKKLYKEESSQK
jgi:metal-responsive CopG/Arc/MetJ family transcriptional regulator